MLLQTLRTKHTHAPITPHHTVFLFVFCTGKWEARYSLGGSKYKVSRELLGGWSAHTMLSLPSTLMHAPPPFPPSLPVPGPPLY